MYFTIFVKYKKYNRLPLVSVILTTSMAFTFSDLEKSVEKIKKDIAHNHKLISVQELEEKAVVLKQLGETLTDLKGKYQQILLNRNLVMDNCPIYCHLQWWIKCTWPLGCF